MSGIHLTDSQLEDAMFLRETMNWPRWPLCPVYKYDEKGEKVHQTVYDGSDGFYVIDFNIFDPNVDIKKAARKKYANTSDIVLDGWVVD